MMHLYPPARPYAEAIFDVARQSQALLSWQTYLEKICELIKHPEIQFFLAAPQLKKERLKIFLLDLLVQIFNLKPSENQINFLDLLLQQHQVKLLPAIYLLFQDKINAESMELQGQIETAKSIQPDFLHQITDLISKKIKQQIVLTPVINPELIGGFKIKTTHWVLDASLQGQINKLGLVLNK